ncbi:ORF9 [Ostreid herpesvirus 1]|nr:ORF9 [Ostreid herpesvirus 1]
MACSKMSVDLECCICLEEDIERVDTIPCQHTVCRPCYLKPMINKCPVCRVRWIARERDPLAKDYTGEHYAHTYGFFAVNIDEESEEEEEEEQVIEEEPQTPEIDPEEIELPRRFVDERIEYFLATGLRIDYVLTRGYCPSTQADEQEVLYLPLYTIYCNAYDANDDILHGQEIEITIQITRGECGSGWCEAQFVYVSITDSEDSGPKPITHSVKGGIGAVRFSREEIEFELQTPLPIESRTSYSHFEWEITTPYFKINQTGEELYPWAVLDFYEEEFWEPIVEPLDGPVDVDMSSSSAIGGIASMLRVTAAARRDNDEQYNEIIGRHVSRKVLNGGAEKDYIYLREINGKEFSIYDKIGNCFVGTNKTGITLPFTHVPSPAAIRGNHHILKEPEYIYGEERDTSYETALQSFDDWELIKREELLQRRYKREEQNLKYTSNRLFYYEKEFEEIMEDKWAIESYMCEDDDNTKPEYTTDMRVACEQRDRHGTDIVKCRLDKEVGSRRMHTLIDGESGVGKSFLAGHLSSGLVFDLDWITPNEDGSKPELPEDLHYPIIILGKRFDYDMREITKRLLYKKEYVVVKLSYM